MLNMYQNHLFLAKCFFCKGSKEAYLEPPQASNMNFFAKVVNGFEPLRLDSEFWTVWLDSEYAFAPVIWNLSEIYFNLLTTNVPIT